MVAILRRVVAACQPRNSKELNYAPITHLLIMEESPLYILL